MNSFFFSDAEEHARRYLSRVNESLADIYQEVPKLPNLRTRLALDVSDLSPEWQAVELPTPWFDFTLPGFPNPTANVATFATEEDGTLLRLIVMGQEEVVTSYSNSLKVTRIQDVSEVDLPSFGSSIGGINLPIHPIQSDDLIIDMSLPPLDPESTMEHAYRLRIELKATLGGTQGLQDDGPARVHGILSDSLISHSVKAHTCDVWLMHASTMPEITAKTIPPGRVKVHGPRRLQASGDAYEVHIEGVRSTTYTLQADVEISAVPGVSALGHFHPK